MRTHSWQKGVSIGLAILLGGCEAWVKKVEKPLTVYPDHSGTIAIRNVDQLARSMAEVTGVSMAATIPDGKTVAAHSSVIAPWLSATGNAEGVTASMLLSITGLAGSFCHVFLKKEAEAAAAARMAHGSVDFNAGPEALASSPAAVQSVLRKYAHLFWRRDPTDEEMAILTDAFHEAEQGYGAFPATSTGRSQATRNVLLVPCTAVLSSLPFITI